MVRVVVDGFNFVGLRVGAGGAGSYFLSLIGELARLTEISVVASPNNARLFVPLQKQFRRLSVLVGDSGHANAIGQAVSSANILYAPFTELPERASYGPIPAVTAIHDLQHWEMKSFFPELERCGRDDAYFRAAVDADAIITFSQAERANIARRYHFNGSIGVVPHAPFLFEEVSRQHGSLELDAAANPQVQKYGNYVLYPAVNWPHKNHYRLLEAFRFFCERAPASDLKLVLTGASCVEPRQHFYRRFLDQPWARERVVELGFVSSVQLFLLMKGAKALVFPSLYEGFGIPVLEALRLGTPVICSDLQVMQEWFGDCYAPFRDVRDSDAMAQDLLAFLDDPTRQRTLREAGLARSRQFSSRRMAEETLEFLTSVAEEFGQKRRGAPPVRDLNELRRKTWPLLFHVLLDTSDPTEIRQVLASAHALRAEGEVGFVFIARYPKGAASIAPLDPAGGAELASLCLRAVVDSRLGDVIYADPAEGGAGIAAAVQFYAATQVDVSYHCFIAASALVDIGQDPVQRRRYLSVAGAATRSDLDGFYLGPRPWHLLRDRLLRTAHSDPFRLAEKIAAAGGISLHHFAITNRLAVSAGRRTPVDWFSRVALAEIALQARIEVPRPRFAYIETELKRRVGHHYAVVLGLCEAAEGEGLLPLIGANRDVEGGGFDDRFKLDPCFSGYSQAPEEHVTPSRFAAELAAFIERNRLGSGDYVYLHMPYPTLIVGLLQHVATNRLEDLPTFLTRICSADDSFRWHDIRQTAALAAIAELGPARRNRIRFFVESAPLQHYFERLTGQRLPVLLNPVGRAIAAATVAAEQARSARRGDKAVVFGYFGEARQEKGFHLLPDIIEQLIREHGSQAVGFNIQVSAAPGNDDDTIRGARERLKLLAKKYSTEQAIQLYDEFPDMGAYFGALVQCDALLLPYDVHAYAVRGSGVALEGLALGIPIIVPAGTDMAETFAGPGCIVAESYTVEGFAQACRRIVEKQAEIVAGLVNWLREAGIIESEQQHIRKLLADPLSPPLGISEEKPVALWIGNDVLSQGCSAVYDAQRDFLRRQGFEIYNVYVPFPDLSGARPSDAALEKQLIANSLGWRHGGFDFGCYSWMLNLRDDEGRLAILRKIAEEGGSTESFLEMNSYNACPEGLRKLVERREVRLVCLNYVHLLPIVESLGLSHRSGTTVVLETHDIQAYQHAIRGDRAVDDEDKELELSRLSDADAVVAISKREFDEITENNPWARCEFVLPTIRIRADLSRDWQPEAAYLTPQWLDVWYQRGDLQNAYDLRSPSGLARYRRWVLSYGHREFPQTPISAALAALAASPHPDFPSESDNDIVCHVLAWIWEDRPELRGEHAMARDAAYPDRERLRTWFEKFGRSGLGLLTEGEQLYPVGREPTVSPPLLEAFVLARPLALADQGYRSRLLDWLGGLLRIDIIVVGSDHPANVASIRQFIQEVYRPYLAPEGFNLALVGLAGEKLAPEDAVPGMFVCGAVEALDPLYRVCGVVAVPSSTGTGTPIKVLDALARGLCISITNFIDRSLQLSEWGFPTSATAIEFADDIRMLLKSPEARAKRAALAERFAATELDPAIYDVKWCALAGLPVSAAAKRAAEIASSAGTPLAAQ